MQPTAVISDLDGTLLRSDRTVGPLTTRVIELLAQRGVPVIPATARQPMGIRLLAGGFDGWAICANGALVLHLGTGEVVADATIGPAVLRAALERLSKAIPRAEFFVVGDRGASFIATPGYPALADPEDHKRDPRTMRVGDVAALAEQPANKLGLRVAGLDGLTLLDDVRALGLADLVSSNSGVDFVDLAPAGVTKAWGLRQLSRRLQLDPEQMIAFGDADNDRELLGAAGMAIAMPAAPPELKALADRVASSNDEEGVARMLTEVFGLTV